MSPSDTVAEANWLFGSPYRFQYPCPAADLDDLLHFWEKAHLVRQVLFTVAWSAFVACIALRMQWTISTSSKFIQCLLKELLVRRSGCLDFDLFFGAIKRRLMRGLFSRCLLRDYIMIVAFTCVFLYEHLHLECSAGLQSSISGNWA